MQSSDATTLYYVWKQERSTPTGSVNMRKQGTNQHLFSLWIVGEINSWFDVIDALLEC